MYTSCSNDPVATERETKMHWDDTMSDAVRKAKHYFNTLKKLKNVSNDPAVAKEMHVKQVAAEKEAIISQELNSVMSVRPSDEQKWQGLFASTFGWKRGNPLNTSNNFSQAGEVRQDLLQTRRVTERMLDDAGMLTHGKRVGELRDSVSTMLRQMGSDPDLANEVMFETIEIGQLPKIRAAYGENNVIEMFQNQRYMEWRNRMTDMGFTPQQIDQLVDESMGVSQAFDEVRAAALASGHTIKGMEDLGYFPRMATRDMQMRLTNKADADDFAAELRLPSASYGNKMSSDWQTMRSTNWYLPQTEKVAAVFLGISEDQVNELLRNPMEFRKFLHERLTPKQLEEIVDSGLFQQIPMTGREVYDYMVKEFELPYTRLSDMFETDPKMALAGYGNELKEAVANSAMVKRVVRDGVEGGWVLTKGQMDTLTMKERLNFRALGSMGGVEKFYTEKELASMKSLYVHRIVADQWKSILDISSSPVGMGNASKLYHHYMKLVKSTTLLGGAVQYLGRTFMQNFMAGVAAGADTSKMPAAWFDIQRLYHNGIDSFDNTKPFIKDGDVWLAKQQAIRKFFLHRGSDVAPGMAGVKTGGARLDALDPRNAGKAVNQFVRYTQQFGPAEGARYIASLAAHGVDQAANAMFHQANMLDMMGKWASVQSMMSNGAGDTVNALGYARFANMEDAFRHTDEYFPMFDELGTATKMANFVIPFSAWAMAMPPMMMRHAMRRPQMFIAYNRLLQLWTANSEQERETPEGGMSPYDVDKYPIPTGIDPITGKTWMLFPDNFDPVTDFMTFVNGAGNGVSHVFFGAYTGTADQQREQVQEQGFGDRFSNAIRNSLVAGTYLKKPIQFASGVDPASGKRFDDLKETPNSYLGVKMSHQSEALLSILPFSDAMNRANPFGVFGTPTRTDEKGNITRQGTPSVFGVERTSKDDKAISFEEADFATKVAIVAGMDIRAIDVKKNMGYTFAEIKKQAQDLKGEIKAAQVDTADKLQRKEISQEEYNKREQRIETLKAVYVQLREDLTRVGEWAIKHRVNMKSMEKEMQKRRVASYKDLILPGAGRDGDQ